LKFLRHNPGKRALNHGEPRPTLEAHSCLYHLRAVAHAGWERVVTHLVASNMLTQLDRSVLGAYCDLFDCCVEAKKMMQKSGLVLNKMSSTLIHSSFVGIANKTLEQTRAYLIEFGMTPASRTRIWVPLPDQHDDPNFRMACLTE
jgi:P27 family predicted phage terminase small subunit